MSHYGFTIFTWFSKHRHNMIQSNIKQFISFSYQMKLLKILLVFIAVFLFSMNADAQKRLRLIITQVCVDGDNDCDGGLFSSDNDHYWSWEGGSVSNECVGYDNTAPDYCRAPNRTIYDEEFNCPSDWPTGNLGFTWYVSECDACGCLAGTLTGSDASMGISFPYPASNVGGGSTNNTTYTIFNAPGCFDNPGNYTFTMEWVVSGSYPGTGNDMCVDAINLGTLGSGATIGNAGLSNYNNFCATSTGDPGASWSNEQGVWFTFTTSATPGSIITIDGYNDPQSLGDQIDMQLALFESSGGCAGPFTLIESDFDPLFYSETMEVNCLKPNTTYYILVDGDSNLANAFNGQEGYFGMTVADNGIPAATNDLVCDAIDMGILPFGGTLGNSSVSSYNNICGSNTSDPNPANWDNEQGVWFSFTTGAQVGTTAEIVGENDPSGLGDNMSIEFSLYASSNGTCSGTLTEISDAVDIIDLGFGESMTVECLEPNTTYYLLVDGFDDPFTDFLIEGYFGLSIEDDGTVQAADYICDAEDLGAVPDGGSVTTNFPNQSNICATPAIDGMGGLDPVPGQWQLDDPTDQQGVWFEFTAPPSGSAGIFINSTADLNFLDLNESIDIYVALYQTNDNTCSGTLDLVEEQHSSTSPCGLDFSPSDLFDEQLDAYCLNPGQNYWVMVQGDPNLLLTDIDGSVDGTQGYFTIDVTDLGFPSTHYSLGGNDDVCFATPLGAPTVGGGPITLTDQSNHCASAEVEPNNFGFTNESGVWYSFIAPTSGIVQIWALNQEPLDGVTLCPPPVPLYQDAIQIELAVFEAVNGITCGGSPTQNQNDINLGNPIAWDSEVDLLDFLISNDVLDGGISINDAANDEYMVAECLTPGQTYYIMVDGNPNVSSVLQNQDLIEGIFTITIEAIDQPPPTGNDLPCDAIALGQPPAGIGGSIGGTTVYNNYCATPDNEPPVDAFDPDSTVWFTFEAPATGSVMIEAVSQGGLLDDESINLQMAVFQSDYDPATQQPCEGSFYELVGQDDNLSLDVDIEEIHCLEEGETYFILIDGEPDGVNITTQEIGEFTIEITTIAPIPTQSNDLICNAVDMMTYGDPFAGGSSLPTQEHNICANDINDPGTCFNTDYTVWYTFETPAAVPPGMAYAVDITVTSDYFDLFGPYDMIIPQVAVFESDNNTCTGGLTEMACSGGDIIPDDIGIFPPTFTYITELEVQCLLPNQTYYVMIDGLTTFAGDIGFGQGYFDLDIVQTAANPAAQNDEICDFIDLGTVPVGGTIPAGTDYYNFCAETSPGEPDPDAFGIDQTVWFTFTAPNTPGPNASSSITINLTSDPNSIGDETDLQVAVYESSDGTCNGSLTEIDSEYEGLGLVYDETMSLTCLNPGQTYYMQIDGADNLIGGIEGYFHIEIVDDGGGVFPINDDICSPISLGTVPETSGTIGGNYSNLCATIQDDEPDPGFGLGLDTINNTVWFTFTPPTSGNVFIDANSLADNVDLQLAVYYSADGTCDPNQMVPINHEWDGLGTAWDEDLYVTCLDPTQTYYLQVDGATGALIPEALATGDFSLALSDDGGSTTVPPNNDVCDATVFTNFPTTASETLANQTNECADVELGEPGIFDYAQHTVWYEFVAPPSGHISIEVDPSGILDILPEIYLFGNPSGTGCTYSDLQLVDSDVFPNTSLDFVLETSCVEPGQTYYIQVDGQLINPVGEFDIILTDLYPNYAATIEPPNNDCIDATPLTVQSESCFVGDGTWSNENYGHPTISLNDGIVQGCNSNGNCGDTWYCFTMPPTGAALIEGNDDNGLFGDNDLTIIAYTGDCNGLTPVETILNTTPETACEFGPEIAFEIGLDPGTKVYLQVFDGAGDFHDNPFDICVSEQCGADNCLNAIVMEPNVPYCWNTASATGETLGVNPGYPECGTGTAGTDINPEHSLYFTFTSDCAGGTIVIDILNVLYDENDPNYAPCGTLGASTDGFAFSVYADNTDICDGIYDDQVICDYYGGCQEGGDQSYQYTLNGLNPNTQYIIMIDGGAYYLGDEVGGNVQGEIMITQLSSPDIDSMVVVDSIACFGETGTVTAEVSGGVPPYLFNWDDVSSDSIYTNVSPGWHYLTVTSGANGCFEVDSIFLPEPPELTATMNFDPDQICYGQDVEAAPIVVGGTPVYSYEWSNGELDSLATMLGAGLHTVTVTDDNGCTTTVEVDVPAGFLQFIRN